MSNNFYTKDPFGVFNLNLPVSGNSVGNPRPNYYPFSEMPKSSSIWKTMGLFCVIVGFGLILYFRDALVDGFRKVIAKVNGKVNPEVTTDELEDGIKPEPKLLTESTERKVECILLIKDKAKWDIQYINKKKEERKAIYTEGLGWTIYE
ncbi:hypothetical protein VB796_14710 [Arcicella sp. LKC2W]|uniref:hypothetical protein n=1 Tax=Arcicella sp. LKC2W TaxID=2984198 RepID=UPI002B1EA916|nr:hypothetical protein [Arcicella sp. LKC2W]MEA5460304.1 hypothetical protein [Arcicella sp. LKC2W]